MQEELVTASTEADRGGKSRNGASRDAGATEARTDISSAALGPSARRPSCRGGMATLSDSPSTVGTRASTARGREGRRAPGSARSSHGAVASTAGPASFSRRGEADRTRACRAAGQVLQDHAQFP